MWATSDGGLEQHAAQTPPARGAQSADARTLTQNGVMARCGGCRSERSSGGRSWLGLCALLSGPPERLETE